MARNRLIRVAVRLPPDLIVELRRRSQRSQIRQSAIIRRAIRRELATKWTA